MPSDSFHTEKYDNTWTDRANTMIETSYREDVFRDIIPPGVVSILEVGCGAGYNLEAIRDINPDYKLTGVDILDHAIDLGKAKGLDMVKGDGLNLPFANDSIDLVMACGYLDWVTYENIHKAVSELKRVSSRYVLVIDYCFVGDMRPYNPEMELFVTYRRTILYVVRNYPMFFKDMTLVKEIETLPKEFSIVPISAWLFEKG